MTYGRYHHLLTGLGLSSQESLVYQQLLKLGEVRASDISKKCNISRTNCYNVLKSLLAKKLVEVHGAEKHQRYTALNPQQLLSLFKEQNSALSEIKSQLDLTLKDMVGEFLLGSTRPSVVSFEGIEGIKRTYEDLLQDRLPLNSIQDMLHLDTCLGEFNGQFIKQRLKQRMKHRIISLESSREFAESYDGRYREMRYIPDKLFSWNIDLKVTPKKVVITTFLPEAIVGIVVINADISNSLLSLYENLWNNVAKD